MTLYLQIITTTGATAEISPAAVIDNAESVIWVRRYDVPGDFRLYLSASKEVFEIIKKHIGYLIVTREDRPDVMYVEYAKLTEDAENGDHILLEGRTADCVMSLRVIGYPTVIDHTPRAGVIVRLVNENMIEPSGVDSERRKLKPFSISIDQSAAIGSNVSRSYNGENLLDTVGSLLKESGNGMRCKLQSGIFALEIYKGKNRPNVKFSPDNDNLLSSEYECDIRGQCDAAFVYAQGDEEHTKADGRNDYTVTRQYPRTDQAAWYERHEGFTTGSAATTETGNQSVTNWEQGGYNGRTGEAYASESEIRCPDYINSGRRISVTWTLTYGADVTYCTLLYYDSDGEFLSSSGGFENGETVSPPANAKTFRINLYKNQYLYHIAPEDVISVTVTALRDIPISEYNTAIEEQGAALMVSKTDSLSGETIETGLYRIGVDYDLGDTVRVENSYGVSGTARVDAITEVEDAEGYRIYPTFTDWTVV